MLRKTLIYETSVPGECSNSNNNKETSWLLIDVDPSPISVLLCELKDVLSIYWQSGCDDNVGGLLSGK